MELKYKLKVNARQFFNKERSKDINTAEWWKKHYSIPIELLDEVDMVYVDYGHLRILSSGTEVQDLHGWSSEGGKAHFEFTLKVLDLEYDKYKGVQIPKLMDEIQKVCNKYFKSL